MPGNVADPERLPRPCLGQKLIASNTKISAP
jgi:hypothetical protein